MIAGPGGYRSRESHRFRSYGAMATPYKKTIAARELPAEWREEGRVAPDDRVTVVITPAGGRGEAGPPKRFLGAGKGLLGGGGETGPAAGGVRPPAMDDLPVPAPTQDRRASGRRARLRPSPRAAKVGAGRSMAPKRGT